MIQAERERKHLTRTWCRWEVEANGELCIKILLFLIGHQWFSLEQSSIRKYLCLLLRYMKASPNQEAYTSSQLLQLAYTKISVSVCSQDDKGAGLEILLKSFEILDQKLVRSSLWWTPLSLTMVFFTMGLMGANVATPAGDEAAKNGRTSSWHTCGWFQTF